MIVLLIDADDALHEYYSSPSMTGYQQTTFFRDDVIIATRHVWACATRCPQQHNNKFASLHLTARMTEINNKPSHRLRAQCRRIAQWPHYLYICIRLCESVIHYGPYYYNYYRTFCGHVYSLSTYIYK